MKNYLFVVIPFFLIACGGNEDDSDQTETDNNESTEIEGDTIVEIEIDSTILPSAFIGDASAEFEVTLKEEKMTFQLTAEFYDDEEHAQAVLTLFTGSVVRAYLPVHPACNWWVVHPDDGKVPVSVEDYNEDGVDDLMITIEAFSGMGEEGSIPFGVTSIYFQTENGKFSNFTEIDENLNDEMTPDEIKQMCADFNPNEL